MNIKAILLCSHLRFENPGLVKQMEILAVGLCYFPAKGGASEDTEEDEEPVRLNIYDLGKSHTVRVADGSNTSRGSMACLKFFFLTFELFPVELK